MNKVGIFLGVIVLIAFVAVFYTKSTQRNTATTSLSSSISRELVGTDGMMAMNMSDTVVSEQTFLENMIPHHQEAINSSLEISLKTRNSALQVFANKVVLDQTQEINLMKSLYKQWYGKEYSGSNATSMMGDTRLLQGSDADKAYITGMIEHHKGAIAMASKVLTFNDLHSETKKLAEAIKTNQTAEINTLNQL